MTDFTVQSLSVQTTNQPKGLHKKSIFQMEETQKDIDLATILGDPAAFTEEEIRRHFADEEHRTEFIAALRARQAERRRTAKVPDVEAEWQAFIAERTPARPRNARLRYALAAMAGAAAMLVAVLIYHALVPGRSHETTLVALDYDPEPQQAVMQTEGEAQPTVLRHGTVSFLKDADGTAADDGNATLHPEGSKGRTLKTPRGMDLKVILPDGSEVWLNAESSISFPQSFSDARRVALTGEAYFKVAHDEKRPFTVSTDKMSVRVLGTEFNLRSYPSELPQVSLVDGSVEVAHADGSPAEATLVTGQGAGLDSKGQIRVGSVDTYAVTQWKDGFFYFQNQSLLTALQEIGRWHNVGVVFQKPALAGVKLHFSALRKEPLANTIDKLNLLLGTHIETDGHKIIVR